MWNEYAIHWIAIHSRDIGTCCTVTDFSLAAWEQTVCEHLGVPKGIMSYIAGGSWCQIDFSGLTKPKPLVIWVPLLEDLHWGRWQGEEGERESVLMCRRETYWFSIANLLFCRMNHDEAYFDSINYDWWKWYSLDPNS